MEGNRLTWLLYMRTRLARRGDFASTYDFANLWAVMDREGLGDQTQLEIYDKVYAAEADMQRRRQQEAKKWPA